LYEGEAECHFQTRKIIGQQYNNFYSISAVDLKNPCNKMRQYENINLIDEFIQAGGQTVTP
jgi:hypothetical protein